MTDEVYNCGRISIIFFVHLDLSPTLVSSLINAIAIIDRMSPTENLNEAASRLGVPTLTQRLSSLNSAHASDPSLHKVKNQPGYNTPVFKGKDEQRALVEQAVAGKVCPNLPR